MNAKWLGFKSLGNLSGFTVVGFADDDGSGSSLNRVENGGAILANYENTIKKEKRKKRRSFLRFGFNKPILKKKNQFLNSN